MTSPVVPPSPVRQFIAEQLRVEIFASPVELSTSMALRVQRILSDAIHQNGSAAAILATGNSQIRFLKELTGLGGVDWSKVTLFHMDEYLGISGDHPASFRRYMREKVASLVKPGAFHLLDGEALEPLDECDRYTRLLRAQPIDLCCLGVGENGHLAFNDPPVARFDDPHWVKLVKLDDDCKMQQVKEGHFASLETVPPYALTLTIPALRAAKILLCLAPEARKAKPVTDALEGPVSPACPASILRHTPQATLLLDQDSSARLKS